MSIHDSTRALCGGPLKGDRLLKWAHLDEAGTSAGEPCCVVAGIISSPDGQWRQLNQYLDQLRKDFAPTEPELIFHAKDIWHGTKKFHRDQWPREKRCELLVELSKIPRIFQLPVIGSAIEKHATVWKTPDGSEENKAAWDYALAFGMCAINFESYMRELSDQREVGTIVAEDVPHMRRYAQFAFANLSEKKEQREGVNAQYLPFEKIVEDPLFTTKKGSALLQIADTLAFLFARFRSGKADVIPYIEEFKAQIYVLPHHRPIDSKPTD